LLSVFCYGKSVSHSEEDNGWITPSYGLPACAASRAFRPLLQARGGVVQVPLNAVKQYKTDADRLEQQQAQQPSEPGHGEGHEDGQDCLVPDVRGRVRRRADERQGEDEGDGNCSKSGGTQMQHFQRQISNLLILRWSLGRRSSRGILDQRSCHRFLSSFEKDPYLITISLEIHEKV
jgi:hypothetical protein